MPYTICISTTLMRGDPHSLKPHQFCITAFFIMTVGPAVLAHYLSARHELVTCRSGIAVFLRATSHLSVRLTAMRVTVNEVSSHLCKILTLIIVKIYLQTRQRRYRIARHPVVTCYSSEKPPETSKSVRKRPQAHSFSAGRTSRNGLYN